MYNTTICLNRNGTDEHYLVRCNESTGEYIYAHGPLTRAECDYCHDEAGGFFDGSANLAHQIALDNSAYIRVW